MKIFLEVTISGIEKWDTDWHDAENVKMELANIEDEARHAIGERLGLGYRNVEVEATLELR
jgi:hypothetical protein